MPRNPGRDKDAPADRSPFDRDDPESPASAEPSTSMPQRQAQPDSDDGYEPV